MSSSPADTAPSTLRQSLLTALTALVFGFLGAAIWSYAGLADNRTRSFLLDNPDMLPQMVEAYEAQEAEKRSGGDGRRGVRALPRRGARQS